MVLIDKKFANDEGQLIGEVVSTVSSNAEVAVDLIERDQLFFKN